MRISIARADLARLLSATTKVVESRNTIPILDCVRLVAAEDRLTITATDLDIEVTASAPCTAEPGAVCVNAKLLAGIVGKASGDITIEMADGLTVKYGRSRFALQTLPVEDFPDFSQADFPTEFEADLAALFAPVQFAISTEETRYYLNGICLQGDGSHLTATATDGHRLATHKVEGGEEFAQVIVPRKLVSLVPKGAVQVNLSSTKIRIEGEGITYVSKLVDGTFPDYERVIPASNDKLVRVAGGDLKTAADRVSVVSSERGRGVKLAIAPGCVDLSVRGDGEATDTVAVEYDGEPVDIGFNSKYLVDVLSIFSGDVTLALRDGGAPALLTADAQPGLRAVIMPMRI